MSDDGQLTEPELRETLRLVTMRGDELTSERDQLRAALRALVEKLPRCGHKTYDARSVAAECGRTATFYEIVSWSDDQSGGGYAEALCDEHQHDESIEEAPWAEPLRAARKLLGDGE